MFGVAVVIGVLFFLMLYKNFFVVAVCLENVFVGCVCVVLLC